MSIQELHRIFMEYPTVSTDTRKITDRCLFFALKGDNFDGNKYAKEAITKGARYAIVDNSDYHVPGETILVEDVLKTLQELGNYHRNYCPAKIIALTGSNGKTTTKELINAVLSKGYKTVATKGNLNNPIGVPLTLLSITPETELAIIEMGANHILEIQFLCSLAEPDFGYITNFGKAHIEGFGSAEGVIIGKSELYQFLMGHMGTIFFNGDDPIQREKLKDYSKKSGFSQVNTELYRIINLGANPFVELEVNGTKIKSNLIGSYNFTNCSVAVLIGHYFKIPLSEIKNAIEGYQPQNNRSQIIHKNENQIILDAYNANPTSMKAALENFDVMEAHHKIVFIGDMFELGETAAKEHQFIADLAASSKFEKVYLIGENFYKTESDLQKFRTFDELAKHLKNNPPKQASILIKGSRGMALERILDII
ncbi:UDP-N-acetylmuramoyl-tripeptide--D-alanyl-D-alanine ligase [Sediminicola sp. 1XM1-17]|uniref:UDP-N-acetylmuramoyl-tripeptide--D-alanyl-D- alanine ligase n=1 Tax=Sediminicola sp. 1XM1-17 TaxID=3127702 RepID=UPI0030768E3B